MNVDMSELEIRAVVRIAAEATRNRRRYGEPVPEWMRHIGTRFERLLTMSRLRHDFEGSGAHSESDVRISAREAGEILGLSKRQVHRIAGDLDGEIVDGRWLFRKSVVVEYAEERANGTAAEGVGRR